MNSTMDPPTNSTTGPTFLVGVAGSSSSGKTTLSLLLSEVFEAVQKLANTNGQTGTPNTTVTIISQDDYFLSKAACPLTTFTPRHPTDASVTGGDATAQITTVDTDCLASVDWQRLSAALDAFLRHDTVAATANAHQAEVRKYRETIVASLAPLVQELAAQVRQCAEEQVELNKEAGFAGKYFGGDSLVACQIGIVEGFLLFAQDEKEDAATQCQKAVFDRLDERLFLVVDKETAAQRRFARDAYIDASAGGSRLPGQMWKTMGYFEDVCWPNFEKYHQHLANGGCDEKGVKLLLSGESTLLEAVRTIVLQMVAKEKDARMRHCESSANQMQDVAMADGAELPVTPNQNSSTKPESKAEPPSPASSRLRQVMNELEVEYEQTKHLLGQETPASRRMEKVRKSTWGAIKKISLANRATPERKKKAYNGLWAFAKQLDAELNIVEDEVGTVAHKNRKQIRKILIEMHRSRFKANAKRQSAKKEERDGGAKQLERRPANKQDRRAAKKVRRARTDNALDASILDGLSSLNI